MARALGRTGCPAEGKAAPGRQGTATHRSPHGRFGHAPPKWKKSFSDGVFRETPERLVKLARLHRPVSAMPDARPACLRYSVLARSEEHTSELQSLMRSSYAGFCLTKKK